MSETITLIRLWCPACDAFTWHIHTSLGEWQCLQCRSQDLVDALKECFVIIAQ